jgi:hypothetical protein
MSGRAWWDDLAVAVMRCSSTILRKLSWWRWSAILRKLSWWRWSAILWKLSWWRWSTVSHWLVVRRVTRVGHCHRLLLRVSGGSSMSHVGVVRMTIILRQVLIMEIASVAPRTILSYRRMVVLMVTPLRISHNWWKPEVLINLIEVGLSLHVR